MQVNTFLKDVTHWCVLPPSGDEPATPDLEHLIQEMLLTTRYQVMLKSIVTGTVTHVVECVSKNFASVWKDINAP